MKNMHPLPAAWVESWIDFVEYKIQSLESPGRKTALWECYISNKIWNERYRIWNMVQKSNRAHFWLIFEKEKISYTGVDAAFSTSWNGPPLLFVQLCVEENFKKHRAFPRQMICVVTACFFRLSTDLIGRSNTHNKHTSIFSYIALKWTSWENFFTRLACKKAKSHLRHLFLSHENGPLPDMTDALFGVFRLSLARPSYMLKPRVQHVLCNR